MTAHNNVPDPDRSPEHVNTSGLPQIFHNSGDSDNSDDDAVLQHVDALVGAPADAIVHQRKLKAIVPCTMHCVT